MRLKQLIQENFLISKGESPIQLYKKDMNKRYVNYSVDRSETALKKVMKSLDSKKQLTKKVIENTMQIIQDEFLDIPLSLKIALADNTEKAWEYKRKPIKPIQKGISKAGPEFDETIIINIDPDVIAKLTNADLVWIMNHAAGTKIAKQISALMEQFMLENLTMYETAQELQKVFADITPVKFKEMFGEERYWKIVTQNQTARITSYALIDDLEVAGYDYYQWSTRPGEKDFGCICPDLDGAIFRVADARANITAYYEASEIKDAEKSVKGMKEADPWLKKGEDVPDGLMPQVHAGCYCEIVGYIN